jgi:uncharacterized protein
MQAEQAEVPPVPRLARFTWMLFMQPLQLHKFFKAWRLERDPSLIRLWPRIKTRDSFALSLIGQCALLLFAAGPAVALSMVALFDVMGFKINWLMAVRYTAFSVAGGLVSSIILGVMRSTASGMVFSLLLGLAGGLVFNEYTANCATCDTVDEMAAGVILGAALGFLFGISDSIAHGMADDAVPGVAGATALGVILGMGSSIILHAEYGAALRVVFGVTFGTALGMAHGFSRRHLLVYPIEALVSLLLWWYTQFRPQTSSRLALWLPFLHHDFVYLPLPGLYPFLLQLAEVDAPLAKEILAEAAVSVGQKWVARRTLIELKARDLERAAQQRLFASVSELNLPFLPGADTVDANSPLLYFQAAARDLLAGGSDHHQRRLALERAYKTIDDFISNTIIASRRDELSQRLLPVAQRWLEVIRDEQHKLAKEEQESPQVPRPFIAGLPLEPDDMRGKSLFKGRQDLARIVNHELDPDRRGVLVVVGQRRMGKSSFRNWLPRLLGTGTDILPADFQQLTGHPHRATPHRWLVDLVATRFPQAPPPPNSPHWTESLAWLRARDETLGDRRLLVVVDEVERVEEGIQRGEFSTDFLDFLRASGDALRRIRFLLLTAYPLQRLGRHWVDRLISATTRSLSYLDRASAEELIRQPIPQFPDIYPEGGVDRILHETHCHPFLVQTVCDELCSHLNAHGGRRRATDDELTDVLDRIVTEEKLFDELWSQRTADEQRALQRLACATEPLEADSTMRQLSREGYVELQGDKATLAVPLWGAWIRFTQGRIAP